MKKRKKEKRKKRKMENLYGSIEVVIIGKYTEFQRLSLEVLAKIKHLLELPNLYGIYNLKSIYTLFSKRIDELCKRYNGYYEHKHCIYTYFEIPGISDDEKHFASDRRIFLGEIKRVIDKISE